MKPILRRELEYHERLYSGFAQQHFRRAAVRALRAHMARRILRATGAGSASRVLSLGCGIGDTELLLAQHVRELIGVDISPAAIRQARQDAERASTKNAGFLVGDLDTLGFGASSFDAVFAIFFLHHLPQEMLDAVPERVKTVLKPGGVFYALDPSRNRLSGAIGSLLFPALMRKYQSPDERQLDALEIKMLFERAGLECRTAFYDFISSPLAGLFPGWRYGYLVARRIDDLLIRAPLVQKLGSNFETIVSKPR